MPVESALIAVFFALVHCGGARRLAFLARTPRSIWLSAAAGISVAYVFLHLLPELHEGHHALQEAASWAWLGQGGGTYLLALGGLTFFHGLERVAARSRAGQRTRGGGDRTGTGAFAVHIGAFALYNFTIGYLLLEAERDNLLLYGIALGLHFVVNDQALREHHKERYDAFGRWLLATAVLAGWALALRVTVPEPAIRMLIAFLAGGVILNALKEELPQERASRFSAFAAGVVLYGALLLSV
jgi:hypothetical protein